MASIRSAMKQASRFTFLAALLAAAIASAGCASSGANHDPPPPGAPAMIYVENFDLGAAKVKEDPHTLTGRPRLIHFGDPDPAQKLDELSDLLAKSLVEDLHTKNFRAERLATDAPNPSNGWLVRGAFLEVGEGNRMQRAAIGVGGAGDSDAQLYVAVADLSRPAGEQNLLDQFDVDSHADTRPTTGPATAAGAAKLVLSHTPYGMAAHYALDRDPSEKDIKRAAQQIADSLERLARAQAQASP